MCEYPGEFLFFRGRLVTGRSELGGGRGVGGGMCEIRGEDLNGDERREMEDFGIKCLKLDTKKSEAIYTKIKRRMRNEIENA